jgi:hypothetical protein
MHLEESAFDSHPLQPETLRLPPVLMLIVNLAQLLRISIEKSLRGKALRR